MTRVGYVSSRFRHVVRRAARGCMVFIMVFIVVLVAAVGSGARPAAACSCGGESVHGLLASTAGGFIGVPELDESGYRFAVTEWLSADDGDEVVTLPASPLSCSLSVTPGVEVAVFFQSDENGDRYSNLCWTLSPVEVRTALASPVPDPQAGPPSLLVATYSYDRHLWVLDDQQRLVASASPAPRAVGYLAAVEVCPGGQRMVEVWSAGGDSTLVVIRELDTLEIVRSHNVDEDVLQGGDINLLVCRDVDASDVHLGIEPGNGSNTWFLQQLDGERSSPIVATEPDRLFGVHFSASLDQVVLVNKGGLRFVGIDTGRVRFTGDLQLSRLYAGAITTSLGPDGTTLAIAVSGPDDGVGDRASRLMVVDLVSGQNEMVPIPAIEFPQHIWINDVDVVLRPYGLRAGVMVDTAALRLRTEPDVFAKNDNWAFPSYVSGAEVQALGPQGSLQRLEVRLDAAGPIALAEAEPLIPPQGARLISISTPSITDTSGVC